MLPARGAERPNRALDEQAVNALRRWQFEPGTKDGVAVPVFIEVEMTFAVRDKQ